MKPVAATTSRGRLALGVVAGVLAMVLYAGQFVISRWSLQRSLDVWDLAALRFTAAGLLLLPVVLRHGISGAAGIGWGRATALAITAGAPYTLILFAGLALAPASHGAVIIPGATPVMLTAIAWLWLGQRPGPARLGGITVIAAGLLSVSWPGLRAGSGLTWVGDLLFVAASILWALYTMLARRWQVDPLRATAMVWVLALVYVPIYGVTAGSRLLEAPTGEVLGQLLYQGLGVAIGALVLYTVAIRVLGAAIASLFMPLIPVLGVLLAIPVLDEVPTPVQVVGMLAVAAGMVVAAARSEA